MEQAVLGSDRGITLGSLSAESEGNLDMRFRAEGKGFGVQGLVRSSTLTWKVLTAKRLVWAIPTVGTLYVQCHKRS